MLIRCQLSKLKVHSPDPQNIYLERAAQACFFFPFFPLLAKDQEKDPPRTRFMENRLAFGFLQDLTYLISVVFDLFMRCIIIEYLLIETW